MQIRSAVSKINKRGVLLVFPVNNRPEPASLWSEFFPRTKMRWEWDESGDNRVGDLWQLMKKLSDGRQVVYSKWYQGRATFFSRELFTALLRLHMHSQENEGESLRRRSQAARDILDALESDSPLSTKELKKITELRGRLNEPIYTRAMKELFLSFQVVAFGEVDDGAFPSLAVGATRHLYEDLCREALQMSEKQAKERLDEYMPPGSQFRKFYDKNYL